MIFLENSEKLRNLVNYPSQLCPIPRHFCRSPEYFSVHGPEATSDAPEHHRLPPDNERKNISRRRSWFQPSPLPFEKGGPEFTYTMMYILRKLCTPPKANWIWENMDRKKTGSFHRYFENSIENILGLFSWKTKNSQPLRHFHQFLPQKWAENRSLK